MTRSENTRGRGIAPTGGTGGRLGRLFAALVGNDSDATQDDTTPPDVARPTSSTGTSKLDIGALSDALLGSADSIASLRGFISDIRRRTDDSDLYGNEEMLKPCALELRLEERLNEAGLVDKDPPMPTVRIVRPHTSGLFYLRVDDLALPYLAKLKVLEVEAALNYALLTEAVLHDDEDPTLERVVRTEQRVSRSIASQAQRVASKLEGPAFGEWEVRRAISFGIESFVLPWRLTARFRTNVATGACAIEIDLVPPRAWTRSAFVEGLGIVEATWEMRRRAATDYNLRLGLLLGTYTLMVAPELTSVWVAGIQDSPSGHTCYYSVRFDRALVEGWDLSGSFDPITLMRSAGATMNEDAHMLSGVHQGFSLEDELFCPHGRYDPPELSLATLKDQPARALGTKRVFDLGIDEACRRRKIATQVSRQLTSSTEDNVRLILRLSASEQAPDVDEAARRCVLGLIEGTLAEDAETVAKEFVDGDPLAHALASARELLETNDAAGASKMAKSALEPLEKAGTYADTDTTSWRAFDSYVDRALYNRLLARPGEKCSLVPASYFEAHLLASTAELVSGNVEDAVAHARRARELAPLSTQASLHLSECLQVAGDDVAAEDEARRLLSLAHDRQTLGLGYLRMAQIHFQRGSVLVAQACYQRSLSFLPISDIVGAMSVVALLAQAGKQAQGTLDADRVEELLVGAKIPIAPTEEVGEIFLEAAKASLDENIFCVARDFLVTLTSLLRDDVYFGMRRSIENEPDS